MLPFWYWPKAVKYFCHSTKSENGILLLVEFIMIKGSQGLKNFSPQK
jgi:hypothetical protein